MITGFLHPGAMGASMAACCSGTRLWVGEGRSPATGDRATQAGMIEVDSLAELVERAEVIVSVCPPSEAPRVAEGVAAIGFVGTAAWKHRIGFVPDPPMPQLLNPKLRGIDQKST